MCYTGHTHFPPISKYFIVFPDSSLLAYLDLSQMDYFHSIYIVYPLYNVAKQDLFFLPRGKVLPSLFLFLYYVNEIRGALYTFNKCCFPFALPDLCQAQTLRLLHALQRVPELRALLPLWISTYLYCCCCSITKFSVIRDTGVLWSYTCDCFSHL